jgi:cellulose synthase/poly-beta-1,6-N-acetylglucosamine synthase-like glycosyltransferase
MTYHAAMVSDSLSLRVRELPVFKASDYPAYIFLTAAILSAISWMIEGWMSKSPNPNEMVVFLAVSITFLYSYSIALFRWFLIPLMRRPKPMTPRTNLRVGVATTFVPGLESLDMLQITIQYLVDMDYPHETWVLDEGNDDEVKDLCDRLGVFYYTRNGKAHYQTRSGEFEKKTKHGNYNAWLDQVGYSKYDVIVGFDPDHVPDQHFLMAALGYFSDHAVGYVQLPQVYYNQSASFIACGAAQETYSYYSITQMSSYAFGFPIVTGCHNLHRTEALRGVGGFAAHDADDLLITLLYRSAGWRGVYVPEIHAKGLTPTDWPNYFSQQLRWARSVLDVKLRAFPELTTSMPATTRLMSFLHGFYYVQEGMIGFISTATLIFLLTGGMKAEFLSRDVILKFLVVGVVFLLADLWRQRFFLDPRKEWGFHVQAGILRFAKWPYLLMGLIDAIIGRKSPYTITLKIRSKERYKFFMWPHFFVAVLLSLAWITGHMMNHTINTYVLQASGIIILVSLLLVVSETWAYPDPFDARILRKELLAWGRTPPALPPVAENR